MKKTGLLRKAAVVLSGAATYLVFSLVLTGYDHITTHPGINGAVTKGFTERYFASINPASTFYYYTFVFSGSGTMEGEGISSGGMLEAKTSKMDKNVTGWIEHGGMSADEPQLPASFVHFYDPTQPAGQRYLKDLLDDFYVGWAVDNPKTDHVEWAISDDRNEYNYESAKQAFKHALEQADPDYRELNMAHAWRAFGQTLHLIADMGIASHVRDDAHPGVGSGTVGYRWAYDADPYEEVVYQHTSTNGMDDLLKGSVDPAVESFSQSAKTVKSIAEQLAAYTNQNFFSHETISGTGVIPKIHPEKTYPSPKTDACTYNSTTHVYSRTIGGNTVKMCKDLSYLAVMNGFRGYPYIDKECALSQATALLPQIREAGINALRCFIPKIQLKITALGDDFIEGTVTHITDEEYPEEIRYNGVVKIKRASNLELIDEVTCENGVFKDDINLGSFNRSSEQLLAEIECGYVYIKSEPFVESPPPKWKYMKFDMGQINGIYDFRNSSGTSEVERVVDWKSFDHLMPGTFEDGVFSVRFDTTDWGWTYVLECTLEIDLQRQIITGGSFSSEIYATSSPDKRYDRMSFDLGRVEATQWFTHYGAFKLGGSDVCDPNRLFNLSHTDYDNHGSNMVFDWRLKSYSCSASSYLIFSFRENRL